MSSVKSMPETKSREHAYDVFYSDELEHMYVNIRKRC